MQVVLSLEEIPLYFDNAFIEGRKFFEEGGGHVWDADQHKLLDR
jgi:hypothetical protein